jgi:DNA repair protein RadA/Sms
MSDANTPAPDLNEDVTNSDSPDVEMKVKAEDTQDEPKVVQVIEFDEKVLREDEGIWDHAFDESTEIEIPKYLDNPMKTGIGYMDYILGDAGFYPTQCTVMTGDPGCGKTTLALEMASAMRGLGTTVVFASCEMRKEMVAKFQKRLKARHPVMVVTDKILKTKRGSTRVPFASHVPTLIETCERIRARQPDRPFMLVVDSLQELDDGYFRSGRKTSKTAYRALDQLNQWCKQTECALVVIGQVTKSGQMAGSNGLKHLIDAHLHLSVETKDEEMRGARILQATKNRFAGCGQLAFLQMKETGLHEIARIKEGSM